MNLILKRAVIAGITSLAIGVGLNRLVEAFLPALSQEYQTSGIFRPWSDPLMMIYFAYPFVLGVVLAYFWPMIESQIKAKDPVQQAMRFANLYFIIATIPGMFITYSSFQVSAQMVILWAVTGYIQTFVIGWVFAIVRK